MDPHAKPASAPKLIRPAGPANYKKHDGKWKLLCKAGTPDGLTPYCQSKASDGRGFCRVHSPTIRTANTKNGKAIDRMRKDLLALAEEMSRAKDVRWAEIIRGIAR